VIHAPKGHESGNPGLPWDVPSRNVFAGTSCLATISCPSGTKAIRPSKGIPSSYRFWGKPWAILSCPFGVEFSPFHITLFIGNKIAKSLKCNDYYSRRVTLLHAVQIVNAAPRAFGH
jgi:hypothetical protein